MHNSQKKLKLFLVFMCFPLVFAYANMTEYNSVKNSGKLYTSDISKMKERMKPSSQNYSSATSLSNHDSMSGYNAMKDGDKVYLGDQTNSLHISLKKPPPPPPPPRPPKPPVIVTPPKPKPPKPRPVKRYWKSYTSKGIASRRISAYGFSYHLSIGVNGNQRGIILRGTPCGGYHRTLNAPFSINVCGGRLSVSPAEFVYGTVYGSRFIKGRKFRFSYTK